MFSQVSVILFTGGSGLGGGFLLPDVGSGPGGGPGGGTCSRGVPGGDPPPEGYCCTAAASYWNAFLF